MPKVLLVFCTLILSGVAIAENDDKQNVPVPESLNNYLNIDSLKQHPKILVPDFYKHRYQNKNHITIPSLPVDPQVDKNMPRMALDPQVDAKILRVYPHVGTGLLKPLPDQLEQLPFKYKFKHLPEMK